MCGFSVVAQEIELQSQFREPPCGIDGTEFADDAGRDRGVDFPEGQKLRRSVLRGVPV